MTLQRSSNASSASTEAPPIVHDVLRSPGQPLDSATRSFMEPRFGADFSNVWVHTDAKAAASAKAVNALAYTVGNNVVFGESRYAPSSHDGSRLLAHELTHVRQQGAAPATTMTASSEHRHESPSAAEANPVVLRRSPSPALQRTVHLNVLDWDATKLNEPAITNSDDGESFLVPPKPDQIQVSGLVEVDGDATDDCAGWQIGTTQTAWIAWAIQYYRGRHPGEGAVTILRRHTLPIRDPGTDGNIWYDESRVRSPGDCGDSAGIFHIDGPWEWIPKMVTNDSAGGVTNYLRGYTRGLHLVTYLTARDPEGNFLATPLRFVYWNSLHNFTFTPDFDQPHNLWATVGQVKMNIGTKGRGSTTDAPYFTTSGPTFNDQFNDQANLVRHESA